MIGYAVRKPARSGAGGQSGSVISVPRSSPIEGPVDARLVGVAGTRDRICASKSGEGSVGEARHFHRKRVWLERAIGVRWNSCLSQRRMVPLQGGSFRIRAPAHRPGHNRWVRLAASGDQPLFPIGVVEVYSTHALGQRGGACSASWHKNSTSVLHQPGRIIAVQGLSWLAPFAHPSRPPVRPRAIFARHDRLLSTKPLRMDPRGCSCGLGRLAGPGTACQALRRRENRCTWSLALVVSSNSKFPVVAGPSRPPQPFVNSRLFSPV